MMLRQESSCRGGLHHRQSGGSKVDSFLGHQSELILVDEISMLDTPDSSLHSIPGPLASEAMRGHPNAALC